MWRGPERVRTRSGGNGYLFFPKLQAQCRKKNRISSQRLLFFILSIIEYHFVNGCCWNDLSTSHLLPSSPFPPLLLEHYPQQKPIYDKPPVVLSSHQHKKKISTVPWPRERVSVCDGIALKYALWLSLLGFDQTIIQGRIF
jgi:hypothetical protein